VKRKRERPSDDGSDEEIRDHSKKAAKTDSKDDPERFCTFCLHNFV
jgi:hypothetical protein